MPNPLVQKYRDALAASGAVDPRSDDEITTQLGQLAEQNNRGLFEANPEFRDDYYAIREANAPSLMGEAGRALKAGTQELAATALGAGALATGSDYLKEKARSFEEDAAANAPTVPTMEDIGGVKDAARYGIAKIAGSVPALAEGVGLAAGGAALGSVLGPGGTAAGAIEGGVEGFLGRGIVKSAIRRLLAKEVIHGTEASVAAAIQAGDKELLAAVAREATDMAARRSGTAANALNAYAQNAGALYNETDDRALAAIGGAAGALPAVVLPEVVIHKLYPGVAKEVGKQLGSQYVTRLATEALKDAGVLGSAMALQEATNLVAKNIAAGRDATDFSDADWTRIREAAIGGALTGPLASPLTARTNETTFNPAAAKAEAAKSALAEKMGVTTPVETPPPATTEAPVAVPPARRVALMTDEQKAARLVDLSAREAALTADEAQEMTLLQALAPRNEAALRPEESDTTASAPAPDVPVPVENVEAPAADVAKAVSIEANDHPVVAAKAPELLPVIVADELRLDPKAYEGEAAPDQKPPQIFDPARVGAEGNLPRRGAIKENQIADPLFVQQVQELATQGKSLLGIAARLDSNTETVAEVVKKNGIALSLKKRAPDIVVTPSFSTEPARAAESPTLGAGESPAPVAALPEARPVEVPTVPESPSLEQRLREELAKPSPFSFGKINEARGTLDLRNDPRFENLTPEQAAKLPVEGAIDAGGNRSKTRVAVVLEAPDGHFVKTGLLVPQEMATIGGAGERESGPAVQSMARILGKGESVQKILKEGGNRPALLSDVVAAGYKLRAIVHFDEAPGSIFQRFDSRDAFDAAYASSPKATSTAAAKAAPTLSAAEGIERRNVLAQREEIQRQIDTLGAEMVNADPARAAEITDEINQHYADLAKLPEPRMMTAEVRPTPVPIEADRTNQFTAATARLRQAGAKTELFSRTFLQASIGDEIGRRIEALSERYMGAKPDEQPALQAQIERLQAQANAVEKVRGVAYSPWHIAVGLDDVQHQNLSDLVALLHEGGHAILGRDPAMQARVLRAVDGTFAELQAKLAALQEQTGVREALRGDPEELLVSTLAQKFATEGIPDAPSLSRAVLQWVKDLYYRLAMGVQAAFGREPDPKLALDWFENQMRRVVGGDYDYRFSSLFDRLQPEAPSQEVVRLNRSGGTPAEVSDFYDPHTQKLLQPEALADSRDALAWNLRFMTEEDERASKELDLPAPEARARRMAAAIGDVNDFVKRAYDEIAPPTEGGERMPFDEFWTLVGRGDQPEALLADLEQKFPGAASAKIGGERMTTPMNERARVELKKLVYAMQRAVVSRDATKEETATRAEAAMVDAAKKLTKIEGDLRNAEMHRATLGDSLKAMVRDMAKGMRRGLDTAFAAGELARAVREAEGLAEREAIPAEYQRVFKAVLADEVPVFDYMEAIAKLDMPLHEMSRAEILSGIEDNAAGDPVLARLMEPKNKPLLVALAALAKKEAQQMDLIQMRAIKDPAAYLALKAQLDEIRRATPEQLQAMERAFAAGTKATTMADRIQRAAVKERARLRRAQATIQQAEASREILGKMKAALAAKIDDIETGGMPAPSEWRPFSGEKYLAMNQDADGTWRANERTLQWNPDGTAANAAELLTALARNDAYLKANAKKAGSKTYELIKRQWQELSMIDVLRKTPEIKRTWLEKFFLPSTKLLVSGGGAGAARVEQKMNRFQFLTDIKYWRSQFEISAVEWSNQLEKATRAAGMKDTKAFLENVVEPVRYLIQAEEGRDEAPVLREAVRAAKRRLTTEPKPEFDEALKGLLRMDKAESEKFRRFAEENGVYVQDDRLGELRGAVGRGWFTLPRSMRAATVSTILRDMENAGWKMVFKDAKTDTKAIKRLDQGVSGGERVVDAASFDSLLPENATNDADAEARMKVLENPEAFAQAISGFFTPGIVRRWLEPFINKPGEPVFFHAGEGIDPLDVQQAWQESGGNVAKWIDTLGERVGLAKDIAMDEDGATLELGDMSLEAQWRAAMLKRLDALFLMESRVAADANQTKGLFDATARPAHLIMDARENELLPPEHVEHAAFDHQSSRNLLATLAFHAAFGRNGEAINRDIAEIQTNLRARKQAYDDIVTRASAKEDRERMAKEAGYDFKELKRAANVYSTVNQGIAALKAQFGFNSSATMLADVRGGLELLHFIASQTTNNPKTGLLNMLQPAQRAIARGSIGPATIRDTTSAYGNSARTFFGSAMEAMGLHLMHASRYASVIGASQGQAMGKVPASIVFGMKAGARGEKLPAASQAMRVISAAQKRGRLGLGEVREFPALQAIPVVNQVMHGIGLNFGISNGTAESRAIEGLVHAAMQHFAANPDHLADPTYSLTHADIAAQDRTLALDKKSFDYLRRKMVEYNIGPLERVTRDAMDRATRAEPILTDDQTLKALQISLNDIDLVSSINTNPATWDTNRGLRLITPLLGWPIRQMNSIHEAMRTERGFEPTFAQFKQAAKTLGILAAWSLPVGLAFTLLTDIYDEKLLKKKTNLGRISALDLVPGGAALGLATSDIPLKEHLTAIAQRLSRAGNIYGLGFDAFASTLAGADPTSGQRPFSMDGRILAFSQLMNLRDALSNWYNSGFATTYANFERPLIQAIAGSGPLQAMDIFGNVMGIDNQEMRIAQRTNASQWLRAAGREAGVEIRRSGGGSTAPTPMSVWTREMYLAALANDRLDFMDAYRRAVDAAREENPDNPEVRVIESWRSRNPLDVFKTKPDDAKMARMLATMSDGGRQAVTDALRLYQQYTDLIAVTPAERYEHRILAQQRRAPNLESLRARMAGGALGFR